MNAFIDSFVIIRRMKNVKLQRVPIRNYLVQLSVCYEPTCPNLSRSLSDVTYDNGKTIRSPGLPQAPSERSV